MSLLAVKFPKGMLIMVFLTPSVNFIIVRTTKDVQTAQYFMNVFMCTKVLRGIHD